MDGGEMKGTHTLYIATILIAAALVAGLTVSCKKQRAKAPAGYTQQQIETGKALVEQWKCNFCHSPEIAGTEGPMPDPARLLSGHPQGEAIPDMSDMIITSPEYMEFLDNLDTTVWATDNRIVFSSNLTPDNETGIGTWNETTFIETIRQGQHAGLGRRLKYPMPWQELAELDDAQLVAIFAYLSSVKPVSNKVPESIVLFR
jgi:cytochrome c553